MLKSAGIYVARYIGTIVHKSRNAHSLIIAIQSNLCLLFKEVFGVAGAQIPIQQQAGKSWFQSHNCRWANILLDIMEHLDNLCFYLIWEEKKCWTVTDEKQTLDLKLVKNFFAASGWGQQRKTYFKKVEIIS